ncbi:MAG: TldD/PmbA family protein [Lachnospiraceae bacterium]|nr:TldD/PmbA family protein [Lachnospiraceae bacterium]
MADLKMTAQKVQKVIEEAKLTKSRFCVEEKETQEFTMENGEFSLFRTLFDKNLSVNVFHNQKKGSASTNKFDDAAIHAVVEAAVTSSESAVADEAYDIAPKQDAECFEVGIYEPDMDLLFERTKELGDNIKEQFPKIQVMQIIVSHVKVHEIYWNSNGTELETYAGAYRLTVEFSGNDGEKTTSLNYTGISTTDLSEPFIEQGAIKRQLEDTVKQLKVKPMEGKFEGTVVLMPECVNEFLYYITSCFAGDSVVLEKTSIWLDKIGEQVADSRLTVSFDPMNEKIVDFERYTPDGFKSEPYDFIQKGVLKSFKTSLYVANKNGSAPAKNMSYSMVVEAGDTAVEDIIRNVEKGLLMGGFSGGEPGTNGEISGVAKNSFLIENGRVTTPVNEVMISGNLAEMLKNIVAVSKERVADGGAVMPYIAVDGIVVSGKN